jgi:hypothetical protein
MSMDTGNATEGVPNRIQLKWATRFFLSHDGVVTRTDGSVVRDCTLTQARGYARQDIRFDPLRLAKSGVPHGRHGGGLLVYQEDGSTFVELVRLMSPAERTDLNGHAPAGGIVTSLCGHELPAIGDTERGWFYLRADDGAFWLMHGASYARHLFAARQ